MTLQDISLLAQGRGIDNVFMFYIVNLITNDSYVLTMGSSKPMLPDTPNLRPGQSDLRALKFLFKRKYNQGLKGLRVDILTRTPDGSVPIYRYRSTNEFIHDITACNNDVTHLLCNPNKMSLTIKGTNHGLSRH